MCIAILNKETKLTKHQIENGFESNPDGGGIAYISGGKIKIYKQLQLNTDAFYNVYSNIYDKHSKFPILVHFRIGTSGKKDMRNVHPFKISKKIAFIHNGVLPYARINPNNSDTVHMRSFFQQFRNYADLLNRESVVFKQFEAIAAGSKLCFLSNDGRYSIMNEQDGHWSAGNWFSNHSCEYTPHAYHWHDYPISFGRFAMLSYNNKRQKIYEAISETELEGMDIETLAMYFGKSTGDLYSIYEASFYQMKKNEIY